jgi:hypothetical protein
MSAPTSSRVQLNDDDEVPRTAPGAGKLDAPTLLRALLAQDFGRVVDMDTFSTHESIDMVTMALVPAFVSVKLLANKEQFLTLWFNADDNLTSGGRSVEAGRGPNYFTTIGECRVAIKRALWQLRHPEADEYDTPENGDSDAEEEKAQH